MREIKFRAWDGFNMSEIFGLGVMPKSFYKNNPSDLEIMEYTGLKDKNGVEIYDGDIIIWKQADGGLLPPTDSQYTCQIKWGREGWVCEDLKVLKDNYHSCFTLSSSHIEIIGNIYENPELLS